MAQVWRAWDRERQIWCAAKVLRHKLLDDQRAVRRFLDEARILIKLVHKHVIRGLQVCRLEDGRPYLVMEIADGGTLRDWTTVHGPMPPRMAVEIAIQICKGLNAAHELEVIHRDVNPRNVLVDRKGQCKVSDFGIARLPRDDGGEDLPVVHTAHTTGAIGTFGYMAPEARGEPPRVDRRTDVYGVGATLFDLLTGRALDSLFMADREPSILAGVPEVLRPALIAAVKYKAEDRTESVNELTRQLHEVLPYLPDDPPGTAGLAEGLPPEPAAPSVPGERRRAHPEPTADLPVPTSTPPRRGRPAVGTSSLPPRSPDSTGPVPIVRPEPRHPPPVGYPPASRVNGAAFTPVQPRRVGTPEGAKEARKRRPAPARISDIDLPPRVERTRAWVVLATMLILLLALVGADAWWVAAAARRAIGLTKAYQGGVYTHVVVIDELAELGATRFELERSYDLVARADTASEVMAEGARYLLALERVRDAQVDPPYDRDETEVVNRIVALRNALSHAEDAHARWWWRASTPWGRVAVGLRLAPRPPEPRAPINGD